VNVPKESIEARVSRHDREIAAIRKLILQGMKMIAATQKAQQQMQKQMDQQWERLAAEHAQTQYELRKLAAAQQATERRLNGFIAALERGRNGHR
jgi:formyltetrahydrofolate synthetase